MRCDEKHRDVAGLDAQSQKKAARLAEYRIRGQSAVGKLDGGIDHEAEAFQHVALQQKHDEASLVSPVIGNQGSDLLLAEAAAHADEPARDGEHREDAYGTSYEGYELEGEELVCGQVMGVDVF